MMGEHVGSPLQTPNFMGEHAGSPLQTPNFMGEHVGSPLQTPNFVGVDLCVNPYWQFHENTRYHNNPLYWRDTRPDS